MAAPGQSPGGLWQFLPFALILGIFYFLILMPMQRRQKKVQQFQSSLQVGQNAFTDSLSCPRPHGRKLKCRG